MRSSAVGEFRDGAEWEYRCLCRVVCSPVQYVPRKHLVGLASMNSAIQSDALFNSMSIFSQQVEIIVASLLRVITGADLTTLATE